MNINTSFSMEEALQEAISQQNAKMKTKPRLISDQDRRNKIDTRTQETTLITKCIKFT